MWSYMVHLQVGAMMTQGAAGLHGQPGRENARHFDSGARCVQEYADELDKVHPSLGDNLRQHTWTAPETSDRDIVFGVGSGSTGTTTLAFALRTLGMNGWHWQTGSPWMKALLGIMRGNSSQPLRWSTFDSKQKADCIQELSHFKFTSLTDAIDFAVDMPFSEVFLDLYLAFPKAKFILTERPALEWAANRLQRHRSQGTLLPVQEPCGQYIDDWDEKALARMEWLKNQFIRCVVPPERLFTFGLFAEDPVSSSSLMSRLASFLGRSPVNNFVLPRANAMQFVSMQDPEEACEPLSRSAAARLEELTPLRPVSSTEKLQRQEAERELESAEEAAADFSSLMVEAAAAGCELSSEHLRSDDALAFRKSWHHGATAIHLSHA